jgi:hypothetical protein
VLHQLTVRAVVNVQPVTAQAVNEAAVQVTLVITQEAGVHNAGHVSVGDVRVLFVKV